MKVLFTLPALLYAKEVTKLSGNPRSAVTEKPRQCFNCVLNMGEPMDKLHYFCPSNSKCFDSIDDLDPERNLCPRSG